MSSLIESILIKIKEINAEETQKYKMYYLSNEVSAKILNNGGNEIIDSKSDEINNVDSFNKPWGKLNKQNKLNRIMKYINEIKERNNLNVIETQKLKTLLIDSVKNRLITRKSDVEYCEEKGEILKIEKLKRNQVTGEYQIGETPRLSKVTNVKFKLPTSFMKQSTIVEKPVLKKKIPLKKKLICIKKKPLTIVKKIV
jgi:hypothetical protein